MKIITDPLDEFQMKKKVFCFVLFFRSLTHKIVSAEFYFITPKYLLKAHLVIPMHLMIPFPLSGPNK